MEEHPERSPSPSPAPSFSSLPPPRQSHRERKPTQKSQNNTEYEVPREKASSEQGPQTPQEDKADEHLSTTVDGRADSRSSKRRSNVKYVQPRSNAKTPTPQTRYQGHLQIENEEHEEWLRNRGGRATPSRNKQAKKVSQRRQTSRVSNAKRFGEAAKIAQPGDIDPLEIRQLISYKRRPLGLPVPKYVNPRMMQFIPDVSEKSFLADEIRRELSAHRQEDEIRLQLSSLRQEAAVLPEGEERNEEAFPLISLSHSWDIGDPEIPLSLSLAGHSETTWNSQATQIQAPFLTGKGNRLMEVEWDFISLHRRITFKSRFQEACRGMIVRGLEERLQEARRLEQQLRLEIGYEEERPNSNSSNNPWL
ncbi:uncharacterized protein LY89DRAFT_104072 [Mollisia scopiformis]|uniref:Uncharacterized protein n=1 Tax=Mollisia scopiformis TaxID=149040 RepID=A0A194X4M6_MOLSC|nr:uncharacterized protein LY89DRAFT_104072 [Mollisia scopiformis]KUJ15130.1 hypothetical protein LY89DRAFT_104072 [Mollisia scopiformis]